MRPRQTRPGAGSGLRLDIGELHLHGFGPEQGERFADALTAALREMLRAGGPPNGSGLPPPPIHHLRYEASVAEPEAAARETAQAIWARIGPTHREGGGR